MLKAYDVTFRVTMIGTVQHTRVLEDTEDLDRGTRQEAIACRLFGHAREAHRIVIENVSPAVL